MLKVNLRESLEVPKSPEEVATGRENDGEIPAKADAAAVPRNENFRNIIF
jgi:hypothetical protein